MHACDDTYLIVILEVVVGDGDVSGSFDNIHKPIGALSEVAMVHPDIMGAKDVDCISIRFPSPSGMGRGASHIGRTRGLAIMDVDTMDDNVVHKLQCEASPPGDVNVVAPAVDGLEAVHDELLLELNVHVAGEGDPQRLTLDDCIAECSHLRVHHIVVGLVGHHVNLSVLPSDGVLAEPYGAVCESLPVLLPVSVASPAVVHRVAFPASPEGSPCVVVTVTVLQHITTHSSHS